MMSGTQPGVGPVVVFLGAGFNASCGLPLTRDLFVRFATDTPTRAALVDRVVRRYEEWRATRKDAHAEQYLGEIRQTWDWQDAVAFVGLRLTLAHAGLQNVGELRVVRHQVDRTTHCPDHERFWNEFFGASPVRPLTVLTTNYDFMPEHGLRIQPRPRRHRPGFHYGFGPEELVGGGFPTHRATDPKIVRGSVPLLKLHGSVSWVLEDDRLVHYVDARHAVTGKAAIVAPGDGRPPAWLAPTWALAAEALAASRTWIFVGYSFPDYDTSLRAMLVAAARPRPPRVHVLSPSAERLAQAIGTWLPNEGVLPHPGLPDGIADIRAILERSL